MTDRSKERDIVLGKTLAETAHLNSPGHIAGVEASAAVRRAAQGAEPMARSRRRFRVVAPIMIIVLALTVAIVWLTERVG